MKGQESDGFPRGLPHSADALIEREISGLRAKAEVASGRAQKDSAGSNEV